MYEKKTSLVLFVGLKQHTVLFFLYFCNQKKNDDNVTDKALCSYFNHLGVGALMDVFISE